MQAVVLAAGEGTRMRPLTETVPKPMLPVADRPLVAHTVDAAVDAGATEIIFVVGYGADTVREYFDTEYRGIPITYATQAEQLGTAHAVAAATEYLDSDFVVLNGDDLYDIPSIKSLFEHCPSVGAYTVENPRPYGVFSFADERVIDVTEKPETPPSDRVNVGAYHFPAEARLWMDEVELSERGEYEITDVIERLIAAYEVKAVTVSQWMGVGRPWELLEANTWKLGDIERRIDGAVRGDAELRGEVVVEAGATIEPGVVVTGPALIRTGATVGPNAYLRGATLINEDVHIGHGVEVKNSVVMERTNIPHLTYVGDSVLGPDVNLGAGTQIANLRHDEAEIKLTVKSKRVSTGRRKLGVIAGPGVKTGVNASLDPGVVLSADARVAPGEHVSRDR
jgi:bifunctional UDP-N-acetylglucosamine pyrophosphorylase/glucosamine-1-phosphate N-acetyltransferase